MANNDRFNESWANVEDPKEKKKMQNRIAQKSYRQRMKARLENLQAVVNYHEKTGQMNNEVLEKAITTSHHNGDQAAIPASQSMVNHGHQKPQDKHTISPQLLQSAYFEHAMDENGGPLYLQHSHLMGGTPQQQQQHQQQQEEEQQREQQQTQHQQHGSRSRSLTADLTDQSGKLPDKTQPDFKNLPIKRKRLTFHDSDTERPSSDPAGRYQLYTPDMNDVTEFNNHSFDAWATNLLSQTQVRQPNSFAVELLETGTVSPISQMQEAQHQNRHLPLQQQPTPPQHQHQNQHPPTPSRSTPRQQSPPQQNHQQHQHQNPPHGQQPNPHPQTTSQPTTRQPTPRQPTPPQQDKQHHHQAQHSQTAAQPVPQQTQQQQQQQPGQSGDPPQAGSVKSQASSGDTSNGTADGQSGSSSSGASTVMDKSMTDIPPETSGPLRDHKLDERFEYVLYCLHTAGFDSFDGLATAYYSSNFDESSTLAMEQRLSRNRGLPNVIAELFRSASCWSDWERRGFHEELLKTTESVLVSESKRVPVDSLHMMPQDGETAEQSIPAMKKAVQNELPNLWALMMALATDERDVWQRNRSNPVLAAILILRCSGRIPNDQLLAMISSCLEIGR